jgi:alanine racemase
MAIGGLLRYSEWAAEGSAWGEVGMDAYEPCCLISRQALIHNASLVRRAIGPDVKICAVVKADGYGHGAGIVADALCNYSTDDLEAPLVDCLAVADLDEAGALPELPLPLLILRPIESAFLGGGRRRFEEAIHQGWTLTVCSGAAAMDLARIALARGQRANVHIKIDTGMSRAGVGLAEFGRVAEKVLSLPSLRLTGLYTHFACGEVEGDAFTAIQLSEFLGATEGLVHEGRPMRHAANSGAMFCAPEARLDMVRPGIGLYGVDPTGRPSVERKLRPVLKWTAPLLSTREIPAGTSVGYGRSFVSDRPTRIGLVPVGYADGYLRQFSNRTVVMLHNRPCLVAGRVSMDFLTIDVTECPEARVGDVVTLLDSDPLSPASVYKLAEWAGTIPYEVLCRIGRRVKRVAVEPREESVGPSGWRKRLEMQSDE